MVDVRTSRGRHALVFGFIFFLVRTFPLGILVSVLLAGLTTPTVTVVQE